MKKRSEAIRARRRREERVDREFTLVAPSDVSNEQAVLAAMVVDEQACDMLLSRVPAEAFSVPEHRVIRAAIGTIRARELALDPATIARVAPDVDVRLLEKLRTDRPNATENLESHVGWLLWDGQRRRAVHGPLQALVDSFGDSSTPKERARFLARQVCEVLEDEDGGGDFVLDGALVVDRMMRKVEAAVAGGTHYPYGIRGLDFYEDGRKRMRPGAAPGTITLLTALSGSGKSLFAAHLALSLARQRRRVLYGAWEEDSDDVLHLMTTLALGWSKSRTADGFSSSLVDADDKPLRMTAEEKAKFHETGQKICRWVTFWDNPFHHGERFESNLETVDLVRDQIRQSGCDVFVADLLARGFVDDTPSGEKDALFRLLDVTKRSGVHSIFCHQQRAKDIEQRVNKAPTREGIIGTGAWLDTPWVVMAPHLPAKWKDVDDDKMELYILKQRRGEWPIGVEFDYDPDTGQISGGRTMKSVKASSDSDGGEMRSFVPQKKHKEGRAARAGFRSRRS